MPSSSCPHSTPCNKPGLVVFFLAASLVAGCIVWFEHLPYSPYQVRFRLKKDQLEPECSSPEVAAELDGLESDVLATFDHGRITGRRDSLWARGVDWSGTYGRCDLKVSSSLLWDAVHSGSTFFRCRQARTLVESADHYQVEIVSASCSLGSCFSEPLAKQFQLQLHTGDTVA